MKKFLLIFSTILILFFVNNLAIGQNKTTTKENLPSRMYSLEKNSIDKITIQPLAKSYISNITSQNEKDGTAYKVASSLSVDLTTENSGSWDYLENGAKIWRIKLSSEGAKAAVLLFDWFDLPDKAKMFVYCDNSDIVLGPYTFENNPSGEEYAIGIIPSQDVYIEYYVNSQNAKSIRPHFKISSYDYFFRGEAMFDENAKANEYNNSENCEVNINCPEGANWQTQKKGVCKYYIDNGICSGTLVNNTSNDGTPYVLSANHCGGNISASKFNQCVFFFNYESPGCSNSYVAPQTTFTGCTKKSTGAVSGGTDFLLVQLNNATALQIKNANLVYNGWDKSGTASPNGVSIHHPAGDNKKISTYTSTLTTSTFNSSSSNKHWLANWVQTQTNYGVTEGGSSGSPLFNNNGLVVGTLSGGSSSCTTSTSNKNDLYGKFSEHWSNSVNGSGNGAKLQPWLDPNSTGANTCPYYDPNSVTANFSGTPTTVNVGGTVQFTDNSIIQGTGITRSWIFAGGTPGTSTATNPTVTYNTAGTYYVSLTVSSSAGSNTKTIT
ncbi:MAG: PKD domain-containing protein, partial [Bacteroidales bacterium]|nr:PKD domain-containing protein [Bacteroidales bacterium]